MRKQKKKFQENLHTVDIHVLDMNTVFEVMLLHNSCNKLKKHNIKCNKLSPGTSNAAVQNSDVHRNGSKYHKNKIPLPHKAPPMMTC